MGAVSGGVGMSAVRARSSTDRPKAARVLIVDDHELTRHGLTSVLGGLPTVEVVGEADAGGDTALAIARDVRPDLVLMDVRMPGRDGLETTRALRAEFPNVRVLIVSFWESPLYLLQAYQAGASGYVSKGAPRAAIVAEVERVLNGESMVGSELARRMFDVQAIGPAAEAIDALAQLTPRTRQVLELMALGLTNGEIAARLGTKTGTVRKQVETIFRTLGVDNRTKAATIWIVAGLPGSDGN
jgi:DNA-binding NarL/FixJ family response regulator